MGIFEKVVLRFWKSIAKSDAKRLNTQKQPENIHIIGDIPYIDNGKEQNKLDIYYPEKPTKALPVIIDVHGGGWLYGNKELNRFYCMSLATRGFAVISINYHLVQEEKYPTQIADIYAVLNWLEAKGNEYFLDIKNTFITGDSAGGHLSSIILALQDNDEVRESLGVNSSIRIKAGGLICSAFNFGKGNGAMGWGLNKYSRLILGEKYKNAQHKKLVDFSSVYNGKIVPLYIMSTKQDMLKSQTLSTIKFIKEQNIEHEYKFLEKGKTNKLIHVFNVLNPDWEDSITINDEMCNFFRKYIS